MGQCPAVGSRQHSLALLVPLTQKALVSSESFSPQPPGALEGQAHALGEGNDYVSVLSRFSRVQLLATLWTVARQAPLSMGFLRQAPLSSRVATRVSWSPLGGLKGIFKCHC